MTHVPTSAEVERLPSWAKEYIAYLEDRVDTLANALAAAGQPVPPEDG